MAPQCSMQSAYLLPMWIGMYALHCRKENSPYYYVMYHQRLKGPCKKAPLSNIMHICFGKGFPIHLLLVFSSVRRTNSFTNFKGGLISKSLSLWLQSLKKCAKSLSWALSIVGENAQNSDMVHFFVKPNYFKKQCSSSSFLLT